MNQAGALRVCIRFAGATINALWTVSKTPIIKFGYEILQIKLLPPGYTDGVMQQKNNNREGQSFLLCG
jgi:hypothetical protein